MVIKKFHGASKMSEDLKYSTYDFTKIPFDDLVRVGQRTMLHRDLFSISWLLALRP